MSLSSCASDRWARFWSGYRAGVYFNCWIDFGDCTELQWSASACTSCIVVKIRVHGGWIYCSLPPHSCQWTTSGSYGSSYWLSCRQRIYIPCLASLVDIDMKEVLIWSIKPLCLFINRSFSSLIIKITGALKKPHSKPWSETWITRCDVMSLRSLPRDWLKAKETHICLLNTHLAGWLESGFGKACFVH